MGIEYGILGLIIVILDIWAIIKILSSTASDVAKIVWALIILALPVIGLIVWAVAGPKGRAA